MQTGAWAIRLTETLLSLVTLAGSRTITEEIKSRCLKRQVIPRISFPFRPISAFRHRAEELARPVLRQGRNSPTPSPPHRRALPVQRVPRRKLLSLRTPRAGNAHFQSISALQQSIRGNEEAYGFDQRPRRGSTIDSILYKYMLITLTMGAR